MTPTEMLKIKDTLTEDVLDEAQAMAMNTINCMYEKHKDCTCCLDYENTKILGYCVDIIGDIKKFRLGM